MANNAKVLADARLSIIAKIGEYNEAVKSNDLAKAAVFEAELKKLEATYREDKTAEVFATLRESENPVKAALTMHGFNVISHRIERDDGKPVRAEIVEESDEKARYEVIDLQRFFKKCGLSTGWANKVSELTQLLALRTALDLKVDGAKVKTILAKIGAEDASLYMKELLKKTEAGETPASDRAICAQIQRVMDDVLFEAGEKNPEKNALRVNTHDVAYALMCYTKRGNKPLTVAMAKESFVHRVFVDMAHRIVTGKVYDVTGKIVDAPKTEAKAEKKAEKPAAEKKPAAKKPAAKKPAAKKAAPAPIAEQAEPVAMPA